uniref:Elongin-B n=1 Tax=Pygocentrus nattereri TaxID=42514 RepID=A0AAR2IRG1_PYGNA
MIRRHKTTIFTDAKESTTVYELKRIVEGILKRPPEEQRLYKDDMLLEDSKTLGDCGFTNQTARPQAPATVGLAFRISGECMFFLSAVDFQTLGVHGILAAGMLLSNRWEFFYHYFWSNIGITHVNYNC